MRFHYDPSVLSETELKFLKEVCGSSTESSSSIITLCFGDDQVLNAVHNGATKLLIVELPGDDSFLASITLNQLHQAIDLIQSNRFYEERRSLLNIDVNGTKQTAINDIYIGPTRVNSRMNYDILMDDVPLFDNGDSSNGLLISTPTGSTAFAFNLGGPTINYAASVIQIQSIASRNPMTSHFIVPDDKELCIEIQQPDQIVVQVDNVQIQSNDKTLCIQKAMNTAIFIVPDIPQQSIQSKVFNKLNYEDTKDLTSTSKFILHVLQQANSEMTANELMEITQITNNKTMRNALKLLMAKGFVRRKENLSDMREYLYYAI
ncbi:MAG: NAD(+)/NADH kinase [Candidatus Heimdallarchaeota archaeon]|nr:NAD(+)/NADH kinase [Candidatus Heimdallarchaeota archaeon]